MTTVSADPLLDDELRARLARLDTAALSDAMDSLRAAPCVLPGIAARTPGAVAFGPAFTVRYRPIEDDGAFHNAANYIDDVPPGSVVVADNGGTGACTNWGSLLTSVALRRGIAGSVVHGAVRDVRETREAGYPLFSTAVTMVSAKNRAVLESTGADLDIQGTVVRPGDLVFADDNGALRIPADLVAEVVRRAEAVERTERRIREAAADGIRLDEARARYGYARPWEDKGDDDA
ncbi:RraA family protein [Streptomyces griseofuscus]|uniref:Putative 4-hydroxy-4-methyl-2-oxoglutarate aldolase n=1 Tax=Streptomyces griseofuscus TaxID=146922 RepID=A0A7H1PVW3_9ACTN|nr:MULTISPECIES: dimethylmenaquinone methyltransferase [Streptomyces]MBA9048888.1 regulator of RNase E activity RraA [Streptomyces murinus]QNT92193.1 Aldolase/RraA [Streptomyces griseofuscus]BBC92858.1 dimethylmenaquinone methyltransferase [Streptomyces rochei]